MGSSGATADRGLVTPSSCAGDWLDGGRRAAAVRARGVRRHELQFTPGLPEANGGGGAPAVRMEEHRRGTPPMAARVGKKAERLREGMTTRWRRRSNGAKG
jgi:hypothetical protein